MEGAARPLAANLLALNREIGELKGASHTHTPD